MSKRKTFSNIYEFFRRLLQNNTFLKILSVVLAIIAWGYILSVVNPTNVTRFDRLPVNISFEGSVPDRNGLMYLMSDTNLTVNVSVSGPRSKLLNLSADSLSVTLDMDSVVTPGIYEVKVIANVSDDEILVEEIFPKSFNIEFAERYTKEFPISIVSSGTLPEGYFLDGQSTSPSTVRVSGPKDTVNSIQRVNLTVSLSNLKEDMEEMLPLTLLDANGENVDRKYLTISDTEAAAALKVVYRKTLPLSLEMSNRYGGDEDSYITAEILQPTVTATGPESALSQLSTLALPEIDTSQIYTSQDVTVPIPAIEGVSYDIDEVTVHLTVREDTEVITLRYNQGELGQFMFLSAPSGTMPHVTSESLLIQIRTTKDFAPLITKETMYCMIDLSTPNLDGSYPVLVSSQMVPIFGVVGEYSVRVALV